MSVLIRKWNINDIEVLVQIANNINVWNNLRNYFPHPYTIDDAKSWLELVDVEGATLNFAIEFEGVLVGGIGLIPNSDVYVMSAEIGYWIGESYWGK